MNPVIFFRNHGVWLGAGVGLLLLCLVFTQSGLHEPVPYLALMASAMLLHSGNLPIDLRQRQWPALLLALIFCLVVVTGYAWVARHVSAFLREFDWLLRPLGDLLGIRPALWAGGSVTPELLGVLNIALLLCMAAFKLLAVSAMLGLSKVLGAQAGTQTVARYGAYDFQPQRGWRLLPEWVFARHFSLALMGLSLAGIVLFFMEIQGVWDAHWTPVFPAILLILSGELAAYLGGTPGGQGESSFTGSDAGASPFANYEEVWKSMRKVWPDGWLAAANKDIWKKPQ